MIPVDSRFCSYCAADLRHTLNAFEMGSIAEAETAILNLATCVTPDRSQSSRSHTAAIRRTSNYADASGIPY